MSTETIGTTATHWGSYRTRSVDGRLVDLIPHPDDPEPHPIADGLAGTLRTPGRLTRPMVRRGWLEHGPGPAGTAWSGSGPWSTCQLRSDPAVRTRCRGGR